MKKNTIQDESKPDIDRAFLKILEQHKGGDAISDVSAALKQITSAVQLTGKPGAVTLTMKLKPVSKGAIGTLTFETKVKASIPETEAPASIFYANDDFDLVREDPKQTKLDLREAPVKTNETPLREVVK